MQISHSVLQLPQPQARRTEPIGGGTRGTVFAWWRQAPERRGGHGMQSWDDPGSMLLTRRGLLRSVGVGLAAAPLVGCGRLVLDGDAGDGSAADRDGGETVGDAGATGWASGGTAAMSGDYPDPFGADLGSACALTCAMTLGPCYASTLERRDISEGYPGLPVRLALRIVDESCTPIEGAVVDVWHTRNSGLYSGPDASDFCTSGDADATSHRYFRGTQTTDADGRVDFDTCYPGWYSSRTIHIHFQVRIDGAEHVTSQLFFPDALTTEIFAAHPDYSEFGQPDTTNASDSVISAAEADDYVLSYARMSDGAMQAWKTIIVRSSLGAALCSAGGGGGRP